MKTLWPKGVRWRTRSSTYTILAGQQIRVATEDQGRWRIFLRSTIPAVFFAPYWMSTTPVVNGLQVPSGIGYLEVSADSWGGLVTADWYAACTIGSGTVIIIEVLWR